ncbi:MULTISPECIES: GatB/YqeY domain-containing protein [Geobacter]|uniref:Glutamyl-tRNA amidotransferase n=2 Tax=Geobacter TaxID=28231 RepID=A0A0C1U6T4_9BACT|nr:MULTISPECIES: GatB/YqeY domain-containing protein [Geobacter]ANA41263.1 glutamyl-tRNA amidotransferase [Geobacter anodireducens]KIE43415.1 glutamyl-tRNA amidotransferase [Geobacter soli]MBE2887812.1 GatB/YqeY domain-containing protein [Geobacter anodireducens]HMN01808.1 GatB/YqeY domain-containing protein [Geobacter anodireducens]
MLRDRLNEEMKEAMKARDEVRLSAIRLVRSSVKNREIEARRELSEQEVTEVVSSLVKQRRESIRMFGEAGRTDLVEKEERELRVLLGFLPQQLTREEIKGLVASVITETGAQSVKDMGRVMKALMPHVAGRADGSLVSAIVKEQLA